MGEQLKAIGHRFVDYIFGVTQSDQHFDTIADVIAPQGKFGLIDDPKPFEFAKLKGKSASLHWEAMFTRSTFQTADMDAQHKLLNEVARMVDAGTIRTTVQENFGKINAANLRRAHARSKAGRRAARSCWKGSSALAGRYPQCASRRAGRLRVGVPGRPHAQRKMNPAQLRERFAGLAQLALEECDLLEAFFGCQLQTLLARAPRLRFDHSADLGEREAESLALENQREPLAVGAAVDASGGPAAAA